MWRTILKGNGKVTYHSLVMFFFHVNFLTFVPSNLRWPVYDMYINTFFLQYNCRLASYAASYIYNCRFANYAASYIYNCRFTRYAASYIYNC